MRALRKARSGSSPSPIDRVLKECPAIVTPLLHIFNLCWSTGKIPNSGTKSLSDSSQRTQLKTDLMTYYVSDQ